MYAPWWRQFTTTIYDLKHLTIALVSDDGANIGIKGAAAGRRDMHSSIILKKQRVVGQLIVVLDNMAKVGLTLTTHIGRHVNLSGHSANRTTSSQGSIRFVVHHTAY